MEKKRNSRPVSSDTSDTATAVGQSESAHAQSLDQASDRSNDSYTKALIEKFNSLIEQ